VSCMDLPSGGPSLCPTTSCSESSTCQAACYRAPATATRAFRASHVDPSAAVRHSGLLMFPRLCDSLAPCLNGFLLRPHYGVDITMDVVGPCLPRRARGGRLWGTCWPPPRRPYSPPSPATLVWARAAASFIMRSGRQQIAVVGALNRHVGWGASFFIVVYLRLLCILARLLPPPPGARV